MKKRNRNWQSKFRLTEKMRDMLDEKAVVMDRCPEAGPVVHLNGSVRCRTAYALEDRGLGKTFTLSPYGGMFYRQPQYCK